MVARKRPHSSGLQGLSGEVLRTIREDAGDAPRGQLASLLDVVDGPHVDLEARVVHRAHVGLGEALNARVNRCRTQGGRALAPLLGGALDQPAERNRRARLVEGREEVADRILKVRLNLTALSTFKR